MDLATQQATGGGDIAQATAATLETLMVSLLKCVMVCDGWGVWVIGLKRVLK